MQLGNFISKLYKIHILHHSASTIHRLFEGSGEMNPTKIWPITHVFHEL